MTIDRRGRRAGQEFRDAVDDLRASEPDRGSFGRFEQVRRRQQRNRRLGALVVAAAVSAAAIIVVARALPGSEPAPGMLGGGGRILYGDWDAAAQRAEWHIASPDGSGSVDLRLSATCAVWFPDGRRILVTNDAAFGPGAPLRPAILEPGGELRPLDGVLARDLELGCGDVSPDGQRIALEGFSERDAALDGIYTIRSSDGGDLVRLVKGPVSPPRYSPDGTRVSFFDDKQGVSPTGSGALFVVPADGGAEPVRITPWGSAFGEHAWSPDGRWIAFQRPYGQIYLVHPDGSGLHRLPVELPPGTGALNPGWSPDGAWITFSLQRGETASIAMVRVDGTGLRTVVAARGDQLESPDWAAPSS